MLSRFGLDNALIWTCLSRISTSDVPCQRMTAFSLRQHRAATVCVKIWVIVGLPPPPLHLLSQVASESWVWNSPCTAASGSVDFFFGVTPLWPLLHICFWPHFLPSPLISRRFNALCRGHQGRCIIDEPLDLAFVKPRWLCWLSVLLGTSKQNSARDFLTEFYPFCRRCFQASQILSSSCANGRVVLYFFRVQIFLFYGFYPPETQLLCRQIFAFFPCSFSVALGVALWGLGEKSNGHRGFLFCSSNLWLTCPGIVAKCLIQCKYNQEFFSSPGANFDVY